MDTNRIIAEIDAEIARLQQAKAFLTGGSVTKKRPGRPRGAAAQAVKAATPKAKRRMSAAGRARIAAAQKARWATAKKSTTAKK